MKLEDKITNIVFSIIHINCDSRKPIQKLVKLSDNHAIGFMEWTLKNQDMEFDADSNVDGLKQLLEIYKKQL